MAQQSSSGPSTNDGIQVGRSETPCAQSSLDYIPIEETLREQSDEVKLEFWRRLGRRDDVYKNRVASINDWDHYFSYYDNERDQFIMDTYGEKSITRHSQIPKLIDELCGLCHKPRTTVNAKVLERLRGFSGEPNVLPEVAEHAIALCLRVWLMINVRGPLDLNLVSGASRAVWDDDSSLVQFLRSYIGTSVPWICRGIGEIEEHEFSIHNLKQKLGLKFTLTDNLADHLKYNEVEGKEGSQELTIFFHVSLLRSLCPDLGEQDEPLEESKESAPPDALGRGGLDFIMGKKFVTETLHTIKLLFKDPHDFAELYEHQRAYLTIPESPEDANLPQQGTGISNRSRGISSTPREPLRVIGSEPRSNTADYKYYAQRLEKIKLMLIKSEYKGRFNKLLYYEMKPLSSTAGPSSESRGPEAPLLPAHKMKFTPAPPRKILSLTSKINRPSFTGFWHRMFPVHHDKSCPRFNLLSSVRSQGNCRDGYLIVAIFDHRNDVRERIITFEKDCVSEKELFTAIRKAYHSLYGWRYYLTLKSLDAFRIYQCEGPQFRSHTRVDLRPGPATDALAKLYAAYRQPNTWVGPSSIRTGWLTWIDENLNGVKGDPTKGRSLGIELVIDWSGIRIAILMVLSVFASIGVGLGLSFAGMKDVQTAWTVAAFIVTAAGVLAAVLAILKDIRFRAPAQQSAGHDGDGPALEAMLAVLKDIQLRAPAQSSTVE